MFSSQLIMSSSLLGELDFFDMAVFTALMAVGGYILIKYCMEKNKSSLASTYKPTIIPVQQSPSAVGLRRMSSSEDPSFVNRMKKGRQLIIFYGSQTGTAEELADRLSKDAHRYGLKALVVDPEEENIDEFWRISEVENPLVILCLATYGEGDPTDNAQQFHEFIQNGNCELDGINYAVFGLGNKTYEHFNEIGKYFDRRLAELGANRVYQLGMGDDDGNLEEDFVRWKDAFWNAAAEKFDWTEKEVDPSERQYRLEIVANPQMESVFAGEIGRLGSFVKQRPPFDNKNPFLAAIAVNRELHTSKSERSCRHIEFDISDSRVRYETGDHAGVFPTNEAELVQEIGSRLKADLDIVLKLINTDEDNAKIHPFPCPCTYRTALLHYVDICSPIKSHLLKVLAEYTADEGDKQRLLFLCNGSEEGLKEYGSYVQKERRSIMDILREFPSCEPPIDHLIEMLPRLQARYYSISSSPKADSTRISITAVVLRYLIQNRPIKGVCSNYLADKLQSNESPPKIPIFVRKSMLRLPHQHQTPVIMIGPGTGFAPFRGFLQDRAVHKKQGKKIGEMVVYFGCRRSDEDFIYREELEQWKSDGVLSELHTAFSRESEQKVYVQHNLWETRESVWKLLDQAENGAYIYVCGDARNMARDVQSMFHRIAMEVGGKSDEEATNWMKDLEKKKRYQADVWF